MTATLSSHLLNGADGTHAEGVRVTLTRITRERRDIIFDAETDPGGRLVQEVDLTAADGHCIYELVFATGPYWSARQPDRLTHQIVKEIVIRFEMPDPQGRYHIPVITSPNSYSTWWSG
jgi:5-hydroxyisourate hydrolase